MSEVVEVIQSLPKYRRVKKTSDAEIKDAEISLRLAFSNEYKDYLREFGAVALHGMELTGIISVAYRNVVMVTKEEWDLNPKVPHNMYVIENTCIDGVIIWQDTTGRVYRTDPNSAPVKIADSLQEYIENRIQK